MNPQLNNIIDSLIRLGENQDELLFWQSIYPYLDKEDQEKLVSNLQDELSELTKKTK